MCGNKLYEKAVMHAKETDSRIPFYVFDIEEFHNRMSVARKKLGNNRLVFAIKANPFLTGASAEYADYFEVCSSGELEVCIAESVDMNKVVYTGLLKTYDDVGFALDSGVGYISAESLNQLEIIKKYSIKEKDTERAGRINVLLRCGFDRFGIEKDQLRAIIADYKKYERMGIHFSGLQLFTGTQKKIGKTMEELEQLTQLVDSVVSDIGWEPEFLEFGPGLKVPYFIHEQGYEPYSELESFVDCLDKIKYPVHVELGRFLTASCGYYVTTVLDIKKNNDTNYAILNGGTGHITYYQSNMGMKIPVIDHLSAAGQLYSTDGAADGKGKGVPANLKEKWTLCGPICATLDTVARDAEFYDLRLNDYLIFRNAGAYSMTWSSFLFLCRPMPEIFFYEEDKLKLVRGSVKTSTLNSAKYAVKQDTEENG